MIDNIVNCGLSSSHWGQDLHALPPPLPCTRPCWGAHLFQVIRACLLMPVGLSSPSLSSFLTCLQLQPSTSSFIIIIVVTDLTNTTHYSRRLGLSSGWKPSLEQSVTRHHISSDSRCLLESTQNLPVLSFIHALTDAYIPFSGLPVFTQKVKVKCATLLLECRQVLVSLPKAVSP